MSALSESQFGSFVERELARLDDDVHLTDEVAPRLRDASTYSPGSAVATGAMPYLAKCLADAAAICDGDKW